MADSNALGSNMSRSNARRSSLRSASALLVGCSLLAPVLLASCTLVTPVAEAPPSAPARSIPVPPAPPPSRTADLAIARAVIAEGNLAREREGFKSLVANEGMNRAAQNYADELSARHEIEHTSATPGLENVGKRLTAAGVKWSRVGENLAEMSPRLGVEATTIRMWLESPGHRRNLLDPSYTNTGAGVARDERGYYYIVQVYAAP